MVACQKGGEAIDLLSLDLGSYEPVDQFVPAYEAIENQAKLASGRDYDLEQTIRVVNALELAQAQAGSFEEFLDLMARQDYTGVAPDVLEAKRKLFPVLEYTYKLQARDKQLSDVWMLLRGAARGGQTLVRNTSTSELFRIAHGDIFALLGIAAGEDGIRSTNEAFAQYEKDKQLKADIQKDLGRLKASYRQYLEDYAPIYKRYMDEYDRLCVEKDQAYLDLYAGRTEQALRHAQSILKQYPRNAEAMLIKSMAQILLASGEPFEADVLRPMGETADTLQQSPTPPLSPRLAQAYATLQDYKQAFPGRTAPALVLEGLMCQQLGDEQTALSRFQQASIEYPRQAAQLTDMLDAYNTRNYLTKTPEGQYLRRLYASTMEGYGLFSPNLLKARHYANQGEMEKAREEIYNHFFRRGNQGIYDELLSDMQFCEENLYAPFRSLLLEHDYLDVEVSPQTEWFFWRSDNTMEVKVRNRSDKDLENVRIFLCIHYTDMYKDEYDVVKVPRTANRIEKHSTVDLDTLTLAYPGKGYGDIAHIRAIAMTDNALCWVDNVKYKHNRILDALSRGNAAGTSHEKYLNHYSLEPAKLKRTIAEGLRVLPPEEEPTAERSWWQKATGWISAPDNRLKVELPRVLIMADPVFTLGAIDGEDALSPVENELYGTCIRLVFDREPQYEEHLQLFIYSDAANFRAEVLYRGAASEVLSVDIL
ncbi:MAG: hypothetical protein J6Z14_13820 [Prevotella sp.]|nr:hypothetical protein [Prevotella sp.]